MIRAPVPFCGCDGLRHSTVCSGHASNIKDAEKDYGKNRGAGSCPQPHERLLRIGEGDLAGQFAKIIADLGPEVASRTHTPLTAANFAVRPFIVSRARIRRGVRVLRLHDRGCHFSVECGCPQTADALVGRCHFRRWFCARLADGNQGGAAGSLAGGCSTSGAFFSCSSPWPLGTRGTGDGSIRRCCSAQPSCGRARSS